MMLSMVKRIILLGVAVLISRGLADCPDGYESHMDYCYKLLPVKATWEAAQHYCEETGGRLAVIEDAVENAFITNMLTRIKADIFTTSIWIGGFDLLQEGNFVAPKTLEPLPFLNWAPGEPDNVNGQHCLAMFDEPPTFKMDDDHCENLYQPLCKRPRSVTTEIIG